MVCTSIGLVHARERLLVFTVCHFRRHRENVVKIMNFVAFSGCIHGVSGTFRCFEGVSLPMPFLGMLLAPFQVSGKANDRGISSSKFKLA